jgi:hypothetical protein
MVRQGQHHIGDNQIIIIIFEKSCRKIWWFEIKPLYLYQEIRTSNGG